MNILFINSYDCSAVSPGGVNRVVYVLSRYLMSELGYGCYIGFYEHQPSSQQPASFNGRILLSADFDDKAFETFIVDNAIDVVQVNFLKKENLHTVADIYRIAHGKGVKVLYCLHVCPGFEMVTYSTWSRVEYSFRHREHPFKELYRWLVTLSQPLFGRLLYLPIRSKYSMPFKNCDKVVLLSKYYRDRYAAVAGVNDLSKFVAVGNALTFKEFATEADIRAKRREVLVVARLDEFSKRISLILKIWKEIEANAMLDDWSLTIVGDGEAMNYYRYLEKQLGLHRVTFAGHQHPMPYYKRASIFLMTSSAEGWPMVLMEALPMGLATVAFDSFGALHDIIEDGYNGSLVRNNDRNAFVSNLTRLMLSEDERVQLGMNAVTKSHDFEIEKIVSQWQEIYQKLFVI